MLLINQKNILIVVLLLSNIIFVALLYKEIRIKDKPCLYTSIAETFRFSKQPICKNCKRMEAIYYRQNIMNIKKFGSNKFNVNGFEPLDIVALCPIDNNVYNFLIKTNNNLYSASNIEKEEFLNGLDKLQKFCQQEEIIKLTDIFSK